MKIKIIYIILLLVFSTSIYAQKVLTLDGALKIAMQNNFDIRVSQNNANIDKANNTPGNAGMLPIVSLSASGTMEQNNEYQTTNGGTTKHYPNLLTNVVNSGIQLDWTLFDGGKMFVTKSKLNEIEHLGQLQFKNQVLSSMYEIISAYYNIVIQQMQLKSINEALYYNNERLTITDAGLKAGTLMKPDLLQAKMDDNLIRESIIEQKFQIRLAKREMNLLLGRKANTEFSVNDSISIKDLPKKDSLLSKIDNKNIDILTLEAQTEIDRKTIKENQSNFLPQLSLKAGYYYSQTNNSDGTVLNNHYNGPLASATLSIPIFNAGETRRKIDVAKFNLQNTQLNLDQVRLNIHNDLENAYQDFNDQRQLLDIEQRNYKMAKENVEISLQRFSSGQATTLEIRQAQEDFVQSATRLFNFKYSLKLAETRIRQLMADL